VDRGAGSALQQPAKSERMTTIYDSFGMEFYATAATYWYNCQKRTAELSPEREAWYEQEFDVEFGFDAKPLKLMLQIVQVCTEDCNACRCLGCSRPEIFHAFFTRQTHSGGFCAPNLCVALASCQALRHA
jgi:hypothetical protein